MSHAWDGEEEGNFQAGPLDAGRSTRHESGRRALMAPAGSPFQAKQTLGTGGKVTEARAAARVCRSRV